MYKVLIADDHQLLKEGFASIIKEEDAYDVVAMASNGKEVLDILSNTEIDIVILDINMPILNGVECSKKINKLYPEIRIIALSMIKEFTYVKRMLANGAGAYILKDDPTEHISNALDAVIKNEVYISPQLRENIFKVKSTLKDNLVKLTRREKEILEVLSNGLSNREVAEQLFLSTHTVDSHVKNLLSKFNSKNKVELVKSAINQGLL